jgi:DNA (cytosine-5)-methyltransferase 1
MMHKYDYRWTLKGADFTKDKGKVFSCFACGGGAVLWVTNLPGLM